MTTHRLKTWPDVFDAVKDGRKTFDLRRNDRDFREGDTLLLERFDPVASAYTGEVLERIVTYLTTGERFGMGPGWAIMSLAPVDRLGPFPNAMAALEVAAFDHAQMARDLRREAKRRAPKVTPSPEERAERSERAAEECRLARDYLYGASAKKENDDIRAGCLPYGLMVPAGRRVS